MNPEAAPFCPPPPTRASNQTSYNSPSSDQRMTQKSKVSGDGGRKQNNNQKQRPSKQQQGFRGNDGVHLLNFQYPQTPTPKGSGEGGRGGGRSQQRKIPAKLKTEHSKPAASRHYNQSYLSANVKFLLRDSHSGTAEPWLLDPDSAVPWSDVLAIISLEPSPRGLPLSIGVGDEDPLCPCPICLDAPALPVMTRCGHIYCVSCLLRYLEQEFNKKCPMCSVSICRSDFREVFSPPFKLATPLPSSAALSLLGANPIASFSLLLRLSGSLFPYQASSLAVCPDPTQLLCSMPSHRSLDMLYSCGLCAASPSDLTALWRSRLDEISRYRDSCLASASATLLSTAVPAESDRSAKAVSTAPQEKRSRGWEQKLSVPATPSTPPLVSASVLLASETSPMDLPRQPEGDVEYLPFLPEAEELIRQKLAQLGAPKSSAIPIASSAPSSSSSSPLRREDLVYSYQLSPPLPTLSPPQSLPLNPPSFLHPLCVRSLFSELQSQNQDSSLSSGLTELLSLPHKIAGKVLEVTVEQVTESSRKRYPFLRHLPLDSLYRLVEIDMRDCLLPETFERFRGEFEARSNRRRQRVSEKERAERLETEHRELLERLEIEDRKERYEQQLQSQRQAISSLLQGPPLSSVAASTGLEGELEGQGEAGGDEQQGSVNLPSGNEILSKHSFATVTQMGGNFPALSGSVKPAASRSSRQQPKGAWGLPQRRVEPTPAAASVATSRDEFPSPSSAAPETASGETGKRGKRSKKGQMVPLDLNLFSSLSSSQTPSHT